MSVLPRWIETRIHIGLTDPAADTMKCKCSVRLSGDSRAECHFEYPVNQSRTDLSAITTHLREAHKITEPTITVDDAGRILREKLQFRSLMFELLPYLPFVFLFTSFIFWRYDFSATRYTARALRSILIDQELPAQGYVGPDATLSPTSGPIFFENFETKMNTVREWHRWFETIVIPTFYDSLNPDNAPSKSGPIAQTLTVGALRLRTFRVRSDSCRINSDFYSPTFGNRKCYDDFSISSLDSAPIAIANGTVPFVSTSCGTKSTFADSVRGYIISQYPCGGHTVHFGRSLSFTQASNLAISLRTAGLLDRAATRFVVVEGLVYNPSADAFVSLKLVTEFASGGSLITSSMIDPFYLLNHHYYTDGDRSSDIFLFLFVAFFWVRFVIDWLADRIRTGRPFAYIFDVWAIVELTLLVTASIAILLTWIQWSLAVNMSSTLLPDNISDMFNIDLAYTAALYRLTTYFKSVATICVFLKFVKFFSVHNQFNILTRTLAASAKSIVGVLIIFALIVTAYAVTGNLLYGPTDQNYYTIPYAFGTSFLALVGDFDYHQLYTQQKSLTFIYFWSFIVIGLYIMLNFITGIIGEKFDQESGRVRSMSIGTALRHFHRYLTTLEPKLLIHRFKAREHRSVLAILYTNMCVLCKAQRIPLTHRVNRAFFDQLLMSRDDAQVVTKDRLDSIFEELIEEQELVRPSEEEIEHEQLLDATESVVEEAVRTYFSPNGKGSTIESDSCRRSQELVGVCGPDGGFLSLFEKVRNPACSADDAKRMIDEWKAIAEASTDCSLGTLQQRLEAVQRALDATPAE